MEETNKYGIKECGTVAAVRVKNEIAGFAISGVASEACGAAAQQLLAEVAAKL
jgi:ribosomal protein S17E